MDSNGIESDEEIRYLSSASVSTGFGGEDLCERALIGRRLANGTDGYVRPTMPLSEYNESYVQSVITRSMRESTDSAIDYEVDSILKSILDDRLDSESNYDSDDQHSNEDNDNDSIDGLVAEELAVDWAPNVFLPPKRDKQLDQLDQQLDYNLDFDDSSLDSCLHWSDAVVPRAYDSSQKAFGFNKCFLDRLKRVNCSDVRLELYLWPSVLKGFSISCISGPKTGKTSAYLIPLMNWFDSSMDSSLELAEEVTIGSIIVCSSTRQTYNIARLAKQWRDPDSPKQTVRIVSMNSSNERKQLTSILNGCDLLITTPAPLLRALNSSLIDSSNTRCLVIDEADVSLALHRNTILEIYLFFAQMKKQNKEKLIGVNGTKVKAKSNAMAFQTMIFAEKWTKDVKWFAKEVQHQPIVVFGSYIEASIASNIECNVEVIASEAQREDIVVRLVKKALAEKRKNIAIVCRTLEELKYLSRKLKLGIERLNSKLITVSNETFHFKLEALRSEWRRGGSVLLINDCYIQLVEGFKAIDCIIHYKLATHFETTFGDRFRLMRDTLKRHNVLKTVSENGLNANLVNYVVVSPTVPTDIEQVPHLIAYLKRLKQPVPAQLLEMCSFERRKLCLYYSSFGKCPFVGSSCWHRHEFNRYDRPLSEVPQSGQIKIVVTYVFGANQFYFRLNEFRGQSETSGEWHKMAVTYDDIRAQLNDLRNTELNTIKMFSNEEVYGIRVRDQVFRVRLTQILGNEEIHFYEDYDPNDSSQRIELFCIDFGHKLRSLSRRLFRLPQHLSTLPGLAFKAHLFGIKPIDNEIDWDFRSTQKFYDLVDNFRIRHITAWVLKQINGMFWLNRINVEKRLKNAKLLVESNPMKYLIEEKFVEQNERTLLNSNKDYNQIVNIWQNYRLNKIAYNSCLADESNYVVLSDFVSVDHFYVIRENQVKPLKQLEEKWMSSMKSLESLPEVTEQQICFYEYFDSVYSERALNRAKVVSIDGDCVDLFLVDHGETVRKAPKSRLYRMKDSHLKALPFQAIKVALFGFKAEKPITFDMICDLSRDKEDQYLMAIAQKASHENDVNLIRLFIATDTTETEFIALSKLLVDLNCGQYIDGEDRNQLNIIVDKTTEEETEEMSEYLERIEEEMSENLCKQFILKSMGLDEDEDIDYDIETKDQTGRERAKESRILKSIRLLKAIRAQKVSPQLDHSDSSDSDSESESGNAANGHKWFDYEPQDFEYSYDPSVPIANYDPSDDDDEARHSDEDAMFEEEEMT